MINMWFSIFFLGGLVGFKNFFRRFLGEPNVHFSRVFLLSRWWQIKCFLFLTLSGEMIRLTNISRWVVQPPTRKTVPTFLWTQKSCQPTKLLDFFLFSTRISWTCTNLQFIGRWYADTSFSEEQDYVDLDQILLPRIMESGKWESLLICSRDAVGCLFQGFVGGS